MVSAEPLGIGGILHGKAQRLVQPPIGIEGELGVDGQPGSQRVAGGLGGIAQDPECRPGPLRIDVVGRDRGHAAPVVDSGRHQGAQVVGEVRGSLQVDLGGKEQTSGGDGPEELVGRTRRVAVHRGPGLGEEVLDDHLLDVTVPGMAGGDGGQCVEPVLAGLTDADQESGGEGDG